MEKKHGLTFAELEKAFEVKNKEYLTKEKEFLATRKELEDLQEEIATILLKTDFPQLEFKIVREHDYNCGYEWILYLNCKDWQRDIETGFLDDTLFEIDDMIGIYLIPRQIEWK